MELGSQDDQAKRGSERSGWVELVCLMSENLDSSPQGLDPLLNKEPAPSGAGERRKSKRYPITAGAVIMDLRSMARVTGRASDLGLGGCYIDVLTPLPVGTIVRVTLENKQGNFEADAVVSYSLQSMGMGLNFTAINPANDSLLSAWIAELSGESGVQQKEPAGLEVQVESNMATITNLRQTLNELISLLVRKGVLAETEAAALLQRIYR